MRIGILECGTNRPDWAAYGRFGDWFPPLLAEAGQPFDWRIYAVNEGELPAHPGECDAWLITGSPASAVTDDPWQRALSAFLIPLVGRQPIVGICYGHQHLHRMLGGSVAEQAEWGVGVHRYPVLARPDWAPAGEDPAQPFDLIALHHDQVTRAAPGTRVLAGSAFCPLAITQIGPRILTFQPHPEMAPGFAAEVYEFERHRIGDQGTDRALATLDRPRDTGRAAGWIMAFLTHHLEGTR